MEGTATTFAREMTPSLCLHTSSRTQSKADISSQKTCAFNFFQIDINYIIVQILNH